jgi:uncharacterized protein (TIGR02001 family)
MASKTSFSRWVTAAFVATIAITAHAGILGDEEGEWTIAPAVTSAYLFRGVQLAGASFQPAVDYTKGPLSLGLWSSFAMEDREEGDSDPEIDLYGAYTFSNESGSFSVVPGFNLYTYPDAEKSNRLYSATFEPSLAAIFSVGGVQFTPKVYYDVTLKGATYEITAALAVPLTSLGTELDFSASVGTFKWTDVAADTSPSVKNWGDYWTVGVAIPVQISVRSQLTAAVLYSEGRNNYLKLGSFPQRINESAVGKTAFTLTYSITL